jgi:hypothetical protein
MSRASLECLGIINRRLPIVNRIVRTVTGMGIVVHGASPHTTGAIRAGPVAMVSVNRMTK